MIDAVFSYSWYYQSATRDWYDSEMDVVRHLPQLLAKTIAKRLRDRMQAESRSYRWKIITITQR